MTWILVTLAVLVVGAATVVVVGRGAPMGPAYPDRPDLVVPAGRPLRADDLARVRFSWAVGGYRRTEVDALLARLRHELSGPDLSAGDRS